MHSNCTNNLLNLEDVFIKKALHTDHYVKIFIETQPTLQTCPNCGNPIKRIPDYRYQEIKDLPFQLKHTYLVLKKRRYVCKCGKRVTENIISFLLTNDVPYGYLIRSLINSGTS